MRRPTTSGVVPDEVKAERWHRFMAAQQAVSAKLTAARVGRTIDVIVDEVDEEGAIGRSKWDAPEIDGSVFLDGAAGVKPGDIVQARVTHADEYDLWAVVEEAGAALRYRVAPTPRAAPTDKLIGVSNSRSGAREGMKTLGEG